MKIDIVADQGTHLLIAHGEHCAVIERRNGRFYNCHGDSRTGKSVDDIAAIGQVLDNNDWTSREAAQTTFDKVVERGNQLAQRML
jgi:hypothetical protein